LLHPYNEAPWEDQVLRESLELRTVRAVAAAKATLEAGFTTLRDLGTEGAGFADVALRDAIAKGIVQGPRVFATTRAIVATGCYGPSGFDPRWEVPKGAQEATGVDGVRRAVREQVAAGADLIKVYADYRRRNGQPPTPTFSQDELNAIVDEATSAGLPVAAHAFTDEAIQRAVLARVATIEHGFDASDEVLGLMRERGVVLCPTLTAGESVARYGGWKPGMPDDPRIKEAKEMFARALRSGVTIACGSDVGVFAHGENARELELMVAYGMSPLEALRAATTTAAKVLRREKDLGRVAQGYVADLIAVRGDTLADLVTVTKPVIVLKEGKIGVDRRGRP
ncbi:MAG: amidohydrolase family protein, partial [Candidatus Thermoplasmatota archaeon]